MGVIESDRYCYNNFVQYSISLILSTVGQGKKGSPKGKNYNGIGVINLLLR